MDKDNKGTYIGLVATFIIHLILILFLVFAYFTIAEPEEESGVPIVMGVEDFARGGEKVAQFIEVEAMKTPPPPVVPKVTTPEVEEDIITQDEEETVAIKPKKEKAPKKEIKVKEVVVPKKEVKQPPVKPQEPQKTPEEIAAEKAKAEAARKEKERKEMEAAARLKVANSFGKGAQMSSNNTGTEKAKDGVTDVVSSGVSSGNQSGYGTFDLGGRSLGKGGLPRPVYTVPEEGKVVVSITVNPQGKVIETRVHQSSDTMNAKLRKAAEDAAKKAQFNSISGLDNQAGTITYHFKLK